MIYSQYIHKILIYYKLFSLCLIILEGTTLKSQKKFFIFISILLSLFLIISAVAADDLNEGCNLAVAGADLEDDILDVDSNEVLSDSSSLEGFSSDSSDFSDFSDSSDSYSLDDEINDISSPSNLKEGNVIEIIHTGDDVADIQNAINNANDGDIIDLGNYSYQIGRGEIDISKPITLLGNGETTIFNGTGGTESEGCIIYITYYGKGTTISGIIFNNTQAKTNYTGQDTLNGWAISIDDSSRNILIDNCSFYNFNRAINFYFNIVNVTVSNSYFNGTATRITNGHGKEYGSKLIALDYCTNINIVNNTFDGAVVAAIDISESTNTSIVSNRFINNAYSIYLENNFYDGCLIENNNFTNCGAFHAVLNGEEISFSSLPIIRKKCDAGIIVDGNEFIVNDGSLILLANSDTNRSVISVKDNTVTKLNESVANESITFLQVLNVNQDLSDIGLVEFISNDVPGNMETVVIVDYIWHSEDGDVIIPLNTNSSLEMRFDNVFTGEPIIFDFILKSSNNFIDGSISLLLNNKTYPVEVKSGIGSFLLPDELESGKYAVIAKFSGDENYGPANAYNILNIYSRKTFIAIQSLIDAANEGDTLYLDGYYESNGTEIMVNKSLTIIGLNNTILDANGLSRIFNIVSPNVSLANLTFIDVNTRAFGGAIFIDFEAENVTISDSIFKNNTARTASAIGWLGDNGVLRNSVVMNSFSSAGSGSVNWAGFNGLIDNCTFIENYASSGGAVMWSGRNGTLNNSYFANNTAIDFDGGAISWNGINGTVSNCTFEKNYAFFYGGAVEWQNHNGLLENCIFNENYASNMEECGAGALYWLGRNGTLFNSTFNSNYVKSNVSSEAVFAGAMAWLGVNGTVLDSNFFNNYVSIEDSDFTYGGAIYWNGTNGRIAGSNFVNNSFDKGEGGAIFWESENGIVENSTFDGNKAVDAGAIYWNGDNGTISSSIFVNCIGDVEGSAIYWYGENGTIFNSSFVNNTAYYGTISWDGSNGIINRSSFINNDAKVGSGVYWYGNDGTVINSIFDGASKDTFVQGRNKLLNSNNFWGSNFNSSEEFIEKQLIYSNYTYAAPINWANIILEGPDNIDQAGNYVYALRFVSKDGENLDDMMSDYPVSIENSFLKNHLLIDSSVISDNSLEFIYNASFPNDDTISVYDSKEGLIIAKDIKVNLPLKNVSISALIDSVHINDILNISFDLVDDENNPVDEGKLSVYLDGTYVDDISVKDGKASIEILINKIGKLALEANYSADKFYENASLSSNILSYDEGDILINHTGNDALDIQRAIDEANDGDIIQLGNYNYTDVSNINITKDITIRGDGAQISSSADTVPIFNVDSSKYDLNEVNIKDILFNLNNGDTVVSVIGNSSEDSATIDVPKISVENNIFTVNEGAVAESVTVLNLRSEKGVLELSNSISISNNTLDAGIDVFNFEVTSIANGSDINIPSGGILDKKTDTFIEYENMTTTAVDVDTDGRVGKYFYITLRDVEGNALAGKPIQIGFNGVVYDRVTDENGSAKLQINLKNAGTYTFAVSFLSDDKYNGSFVVAKIVVSKQKGSLTVPNKSYSASASSKKLTATFKSASGKVVSGKKITFTVNGKSYSATTDSNGVATVKVSLNAKGTYSFTAKFAGNNMYAAISKTAKLTIK